MSLAVGGPTGTSILAIQCQMMSSTGIGPCFARIRHPTVLSISNGQILLPYVLHLIFCLAHSILKLSPLPIERGIKLLISTGANCTTYAPMTGSCHPLPDSLRLMPLVLPKLLHVPVNEKPIIALYEEEGRVYHYITN